MVLLHHRLFLFVTLGLHGG